MAIRLRIKLENGIKVNMIIDDKKAKQIEKLKSFKIIQAENKKRFEGYHKGKDKFSKMTFLDVDKRLNQLTAYVLDLKRLEV